MESLQNINNSKDFQVVGVSRSGRVRKKSSKLLDFESPEEFEKKAKRSTSRQPGRYNGRGRPPNALREREREREREQQQQQRDLEQQQESELPVFDVRFSPFDDFASDLNFDTPSPILTSTARLLTDLAGGTGDSDDEIDNIVADLVEGVEAECSINQEEIAGVRQSLYMREKTNKQRKVLKDGTIIIGKTHRKDKGKSRFTGYSLWAREARKKDFQDLDFANSARRLSELWANVSIKEKNAWRRKAKMQATRARTREQKPSFNQSNNTQSNGNINIINGIEEHSLNNRGAGTRTRCRLNAKATEANNTKLQRGNNQNNNNANANTNIKTNANTNRGIKTLVTNQSTALQRVGGNLRARALQNKLKSNNTSISDQNSSKTTTQSCIEVIDAAAHLKLLGESLSIIGERLKEHDGQIALSGSLSVLLDSLLCSLGPLLCMTTQIPGLENKIQLRTNLSKTLDNIAYVMPGL